MNDELIDRACAAMRAAMQCSFVWDQLSEPDRNAWRDGMRVAAAVLAPQWIPVSEWPADTTMIIQWDSSTC